MGCLMIDIEGTTLGDADLNRLRHDLVGGVILFARNYQNRSQLIDLVRAIKDLKIPELIVAVDQEGGRVQRFKNEFTRLPAALKYGKIFDSNYQQGLMCAAAGGLVMAAELRHCGVDLSFTPVMDVASVSSKVIGDRSFHQNPDAVTELAGAFIDGMQQAGMAAVGKHFPGHGGVPGDSHVERLSDKRVIEEVEECDLVPYRALAHMLRGVMTAHVEFPNIYSGIPALSPDWIGVELREKSGFQGVVFSDDLVMEGAKCGGIVEVAKSALVSGCDMLLLCNSSVAVDELLASDEINSSVSSENRIVLLRPNEMCDDQRVNTALELLHRHSLIKN